VTVALERVVALLVITCPCALGLATPLAVSVSLMRAAKAGIFVKNPDALQKLQRVETVLLDKTGTLTEGRATVSRFVGEDSAFEYACALEAESSHAVAQAFRALRKIHAVRDVRDVEEMPGRGITGVVDGHAVSVGNAAQMESTVGAVPAVLVGRVDELVSAGLSPVYVAVDGKVAGLAGVGDPVRPDARGTVETLRRLGIQVRILSGDHPSVVAGVAAQLGIPQSDALGGLTPEAKRDVVAALTSRSGRKGAVVMVGDGVNDAAALALADVGVAVLGGTGASIVAADIVLTREGVAPLVDVLQGARRLFGPLGVIGRNVGFSLLYNVTGAALALFGLVGPLVAAILMPISSLTVILSSAFSRTFRVDRGASVASRPRGAEA
jgi:Cu2+-exporting ATPase